MTRLHLRDRLARRPDVLIGFVTFALLLVVVLLHNRWIFTHGVIEDGDPAVNSILIDRARHFQLLIGNYSRVGFNHPGPALLYVQGIGQLLFHDFIPLVPRPYNSHMLGVVLLYSGLIGSSAAMTARRAHSRLAGLTVPVLSLGLVAWRPGLLASTWFPDIYVWCFLFMCIAAASTISGETKHFPLFLIGVGLLVHGHVSFILFAVGMTALVMASIVRTYRATKSLPTRRTWWSCAVVVGVFALPVLVNLIINFPGELDDYWRYSKSSSAGGHTFVEVARFLAQYWSADSLGVLLVVGLLAAAAVGATDVADGVARSFALSLLVVVLAISILAFVYAYRGIDDLGFSYVAEFYVCAPLLALLATTVVITHRLSTRPRRAKEVFAGGLAVAAIMLGASSDVQSIYPGANWISEATNALDRSVDRQQTRVFRFSLAVWPQVAGIVEEYRRDGVDVCVEEPLYGFLFTDDLVCTGQQRATGTVVIATAPADAATIPVGALEAYQNTLVTLNLPES